MLVAMPLLLLDLLRPHFPKLNRFSLKIIGPVIRKHEVRQLSGSSYAILGIGFTYFIFPPIIAQLAVLFLAIGDPTASFFGLLFGKIKLLGKKSLEGFLAGIAFCSLAALIYFSLNEFEFSREWSQLITYSLSCGIIGGVAELIPVFGMDDNLSQPLLSSGLLSLFFFLMGGL